jgi:hypothetical protein
MPTKSYEDLYGMTIEETISDNERIIGVPIPTGKAYVHQFLRDEKWTTCSKCGDKAGLPPTGIRTVKKIDWIRKFCSAYKSSLNKLPSNDKSDKNIKRGK